MQEEVTKHTRKIFKTARSNHSLGEKIREILLEIAIIVFAVTLSIWLHSRSEHRHEQKEAKAFLKGLKEDLEKDIQLIEANRNVIALLDSNFKFLQAVPAGATDSATEKQISEHLHFDLPVTQANIGRYEGFKSSGKIETIENDILKDRILKFYQQTLPNIAYGENYVNGLQQKMLDLLIERDEKQPLNQFISSTKIKSLLNLGTHNFEVNLDSYNKAIADARGIIEEMDK